MEVIFRIPAPDADGLDTDYSAKKTWREPKEAQGGDGSKVKWTAGDLMESRALDRGYRELLLPRTIPFFRITLV